MIEPLKVFARPASVTALALYSALLAGCAGTPPTAQYAVAQSQVDAAVGAGGTEFAAVEMREAQDKLREATTALHAGDNDRARRLAEQAEWDARVAERKAQAAKAVKAVGDAERGVRDVRDEALRSTW